MTLNFKIFLAGLGLILLFVANWAAAGESRTWTCDILLVQRLESSIKVCHTESDDCIVYTEATPLDEDGYCYTVSENDGDGVAREIKRCVTITEDGMFKGVLLLNGTVYGAVKKQCL